MCYNLTKETLERKNAMKLLPEVKKLETKDGYLLKNSIAPFVKDIDYRLKKVIDKLPASNDGAELIINVGTSSTEKYTLEIDEKNLETSVKAKTVEQKKSVAAAEVESYGIAQINNASASKKIKNNAEKGFEKVVSGKTKKAVKSEVSRVDNYFDFSFRKQPEVFERAAESLKLMDLIDEILNNFESGAFEIVPETIIKTIEEDSAKAVKTAKKVCAKKVSAKKSAAKKEVKADSKTSTILKVESEHIEEIRNCQVQAAVCAYDDDAIYNIDMARIGSLFDCEKTMLN